MTNETIQKPKDNRLKETLKWGGFFVILCPSLTFFVLLIVGVSLYERRYDGANPLPVETVQLLSFIVLAAGIILAVVKFFDINKKYQTALKKYNASQETSQSFDTQIPKESADPQSESKTQAKTDLEVELQKLADMYEKGFL